ncbi:LysR substrate-binding domain-containing protein [uncultured Roseibium sp.]|uniref:LysR substrate-binding domain-containing protein n=1 Tax=uncultured Roseibium sp. TaxID=1936171 RepID=UPI00260DCEF1|nr:LysR substrate-binding domain-containing protein [uncultured Roseibium sp.]
MARSSLPPLAAVRAFEAAARHGSFTSSGRELGLTQAAVSYQIKVLEERVGQPLFHRRARGVELTHVGTELAKKASAALDVIADAFAEAQGSAQATLEISVIPTFATNFLAERLGRFQIAHPNIAVRLEVSETLIDFQSDTFDIAIRSGKGQWPDLECHKLIEIEFTPMLSPALAETIGGVSKPEELLKLPILGGGDPWWVRWFEKAGVNSDVLKGRPSQTFGPQILEATAAMAGQGVAMLTPAFFKSAIDSRQLIRPFELCSSDETAYWLTYAHAYRNTPKVKAFRSWLVQEVDGFLQTEKQRGYVSRASSLAGRD